VDSRFAVAWALCSAFWAALLTLARRARERGALLDGALQTCEQLERNLANEASQYAAYRKLFGPPKDWSDTRAVTVLYRTGQGLSYATGGDLARRGLLPPEESGEHRRYPDLPPPPKARRG
jgi:hypothetical protein